MLADLDAFIAEQPDPKPSRPEAIRQMMALALRFVAMNRADTNPI